MSNAVTYARFWKEKADNCFRWLVSLPTINNQPGVKKTLTAFFAPVATPGKVDPSVHLQRMFAVMADKHANDPDLIAQDIADQVGVSLAAFQQEDVKKFRRYIMLFIKMIRSLPQWEKEQQQHLKTSSQAARSAPGTTDHGAVGHSRLQKTRQNGAQNNHEHPPTSALSHSENSVPDLGVSQEQEVVGASLLPSSEVLGLQEGAYDTLQAPAPIIDHHDPEQAQPVQGTSQAESSRSVVEELKWPKSHFGVPMNDKQFKKHQKEQKLKKDGTPRKARGEKRAREDRPQLPTAKHFKPDWIDDKADLPGPSAAPDSHPAEKTQ
jgi:hypothetical protein